MNKTFCTAPWTHVHAWATGEVFPCCFAASGKQNAFGNLKTSTFSEVINSEKMTELRRDMLAGEYNSVCSKCHKAEQHGMPSYRAMFNREFLSGAQEAISLTTDAGEIDPKHFKVKYWDVRISNLCNMKCRTCGPEFSTKWYDEVSSLHKDIIGTDRLLKIRDTYSSLLDEIPSFFEDIEKIYFAGGEPLIMDEHWALIDELIKANRTDVMLEYQTNLAKLEFKNRSIDEVLSNFKNIRIMASIDDTERGNNIRHGQSVNKVLKNARYIRNNYPDVDFWVSCTVSKLNVFRVVEFYKTLVDQDLIDPDNFTVNPVYDPTYYSISSLPHDLKETLVSTVTSQIKKIETIAPKRIINDFNSLLSFAGGQDDIANTHYEFFDESAKMDSLRKEQSFSVYPEYFANSAADLDSSTVVGNFPQADIKIDLAAGITGILDLEYLRNALRKLRSKPTVVFDFESVGSTETLTRLGNDKLQATIGKLYSTKTDKVNIETGSMLLGLWHATNTTLNDLFRIKSTPAGVVIIDVRELIEGLDILIKHIDSVYNNDVFSAASTSILEILPEQDITHLDWPTTLLAIAGVLRLDHIHR